jgi:hypothetical protein
MTSVTGTRYAPGISDPDGEKLRDRVITAATRLDQGDYVNVCDLGRIRFDDMITNG